MQTLTDLLNPAPLASLPAQPLHWLWPARIPRGHVTLLFGPPDSGKSFLALDLAARFAANQPLPGSAPDLQDPSPADSVLAPADSSILLHFTPQRLHASTPPVFLLANPAASEAAAARAPSLTAALPPEALSRLRLLLPRMREPRPLLSAETLALAGLDKQTESFLRRTAANVDCSFTLDTDLAPLEKALGLAPAAPPTPAPSPSPSHRITVSPSQPPPALLIIDSLPTFIRAKTLRPKNAAAPLKHLNDFAKKHNLAILALIPLPHSRNPLAAARSFLSPLHMIRSALLLTTDPASPSRRILLSARSTLTHRPPALSFTLDTGRVQWDDTPADTPDRPFESFPRLHTGSRALAPDPTETELWLRDLLSRGPVRAADIARLAHRDGFAPRTVNRAKQRLAVLTLRRGGTFPSGHWEWRLPDPAPDQTRTLPTPDVDCHAAPSTSTSRVA